jgi:hypothetical protein
MVCSEPTDYRSAPLGYCFDEAVWGQGYATEAAFTLLQWAFDNLDINRVPGRDRHAQRVGPRAGKAQLGA